MRNPTIYWLAERLFFITLIPMVVWFILELLPNIAKGSELPQYFFSNNLNAFFGLSFVILVTLYGIVTISNILEDYVKNYKKAILLTEYFFVTLCILCCILILLSMSI